MNIWKQLVLLFLSGAVFFGCSDSDTPIGAGGSGDGEVTEKLFVSVAELGEVKSVHLVDEDSSSKLGSTRHLGAPSAVTATIKLKDSSGNIAPVLPGEMVFSGGNAYIRLSTPSGGPLSTQIQMLDVASDGIDHNHPIEVGGRPTHIYLDHDKKVWVLNDGDSSETTNADSVSVIVGGLHSESAQIPLGSGHKKAAFASDSKRVFISNIHDNTVSVVDNDETSSSYLETILNDPGLPHNAAILVGDGPHGIDYSSKNGKLYNINSGDPVNVVSVIDENTLAQTFITKGTDADQVPGVGRIHTRHAHDDPLTDGQYVYIFADTVDDQGNADPADDTTTGWVIAIDTMETSNHGIIAKIQIPGMIPARMVFGPHGKRLYALSGGSSNPTPDLKINQVAVINIDPASPDFNTLITTIDVGDAGGHGSVGATSTDGHFLFVGNAGENTVSVIDTNALSVVETIDVGGVPTGIGVVAVEAEEGHGHSN